MFTMANDGDGDGDSIILMGPIKISQMVIIESSGGELFFGEIRRRKIGVYYHGGHLILSLFKWTTGYRYLRLFKVLYMHIYISIIH